MNFFRFVFGLPGAALVTLALFFVMAGLINKEMMLDAPRENPELSITGKLVDSKVRAERRGRPERFDAIPPQTAPQPAEKSSRPSAGGGFAAPGDIGPGDFDKPDVRGAGPAIRTAPAYPQACASRGAQGAVVVMFDVTDRGEVTNVRIVSSDNRCFDRAVVKTVLGWKYPPGARRGVTERFVFELTE